MESSSSAQGGLRDELRGDAQAMTDTATQRLHSEVDSRKGQAANQAKTLSSALEDAAGKLDPNSPTWLKSALEQGARTIQRLAESVEQKDSRQLTNDVQQLARQNPGTFLSACALAGFAAARVFKAGTASVGSSSQTGSGETGGYTGTPVGQGYAFDNIETGGIQSHNTGQSPLGDSVTAGYPAQTPQPVT
jgi:hypothetical protein